MQIRAEVLLTIMGMAIVTYATRVSGLWLISRVTLSRRVETWLSYLPGTIIIAIIAPGVLSSGIAGAIAALVTVLVARRTGSMLFAMLAGVGIVLVWRTLGLP